MISNEERYARLARSSQKMIKPQLKSIQCLDILNALHYLETIGHQGIKDRFWDKFIPLNNDTAQYVHLYNYNDLSEDDIEYYGKQHLEDLKLIKETWNIQTDRIMIWICW